MTGPARAGDSAPSLPRSLLSEWWAFCLGSPWTTWVSCIRDRRYTGGSGSSFLVSALPRLIVSARLTTEMTITAAAAITNRNPSLIAGKRVLALLVPVLLAPVVLLTEPEGALLLPVPTTAKLVPVRDETGTSPSMVVPLTAT